MIKDKQDIEFDAYCDSLRKSAHPDNSYMVDSLITGYYSTKKRHMKTETAYISGKISKLTDLNIPKFEKAEARVIQMGFNACNPHKLPANHDKKWNSYMKVCLAHLQMCDLVVALDDWKKSRGACIEIWNAEWVDIPVFDLKTMSPIKLSFWIKVKLLLNLI